jgi:hypothetical protein
LVQPFYQIPVIEEIPPLKNCRQTETRRAKSIATGPNVDPQTDLVVVSIRVHPIPSPNFGWLCGGRRRRRRRCVSSHCSSQARALVTEGVKPALVYLVHPPQGPS